MCELYAKNNYKSSTAALNGLNGAAVLVTGHNSSFISNDSVPQTYKSSIKL